jgi:3-methylcrotonyl-CoA carboxylase beta subunit
LATVQRSNIDKANAAKRKDGKDDEVVEWTAEEEAAFKQPIIDKFEHESSAYYSTSHLWDDGIIDPADTRFVIGHCLAIVGRTANEAVNTTKFGVFRM